MIFSQAFIINKLESFTTHRTHLERLLHSSDQEIFASEEKLPAIERHFQLLVDAMIDINQHLIQELKFDVPEDLFSTFVVVGRAGVLDLSFAQRIAPIVGVRNRLVHQYEAIDQALFLRNLRQHFGDFSSYQRQILAALKSTHDRSPTQ